MCELYRIIKFVAKQGSVGGSLLMFQPGTTEEALPFQIRKVLYIRDIKIGDRRGGHAHFETEEVVVCLRGGCTVHLDDGLGRTATVRLNRYDEGLLIYPHLWRVVTEFEPGTELLIVAGFPYVEADYIRDRQAFEQLAKGWAGNLGGSSAMSAPRTGEVGVYIHPRALVETEHLGPGTRVWAFAHIMAGARVGARCNIGEGVFIESGAVIGDGVTIKNHVLVWKGVRIENYAFIGPGAVFTNDLRPRSRHVPVFGNEGRPEPTWLVETRVGEGASIGANATIVAGVNIGRYAMIGAGAVVTKDIPEFALAVGNPARVVGQVNEKGERVN